VAVGALVGLCCLMSAADAFATSAPSAQISMPADDQTFGLNQFVGTSFSCIDGAGGPGLTACEDSNGSAGSADTGSGSTGSGALDTSSPGTFSYTVTATSSDAQSATTSISYTVVALSPNQSPLQFGSVDMHSQSTQQENFSNQSATPITIVSSTITGPDASNYSIQPGQDFCTGQTIPAYSSCHLNVVFYALATGPGPKNNATLELTDDAPESIDVPLTGTALTGTLSVNPGPVDFGAQVINQGGSNSQPVTVTNNLVASALVTNQQIVGPDAASFSINGNGCEGFNIGTDNTCQIYIQFNPVSSGAKNAQLEIDNDGTATPLLVSLTGQGLNGPALTLSPPQAKYGNVALGSSGSQIFTLTNTGDAPLQVQAVVPIAGSPEVFPISNDGCSGQMIAAGSSCQMTVGFIPIAAGDKDASLLLITNASNPGVTTIGLSGTGITPTSSPTGATGATGPTGPAGPTGRQGPPGKKAAPPKITCVVNSTEPAHHRKTHETCTVTVPAPYSHAVSVDISHGNTTYAAGTAIVRRGVARLHLHVLQTMRIAPYRVTIIAIDGKNATITHYTDQL
jgi:hypothetical protein